MRLLLTLLALLSGWSFSDRAAAAPVSPVTMGAMVVLADNIGQIESKLHRRPAAEQKRSPRKSGGTQQHGRKAAPLHGPGLITGVDRAIE